MGLKEIIGEIALGTETIKSIKRHNRFLEEHILVKGIRKERENEVKYIALSALGSGKYLPHTNLGMYLGSLIIQGQTNNFVLGSVAICYAIGIAGKKALKETIYQQRRTISQGKDRIVNDANEIEFIKIENYNSTSN